MARSISGLAPRLAAAIEERYEVEELAPPEAALVMIKKRDGARGVLFYLGELLVAEAKVRVGQAVGVGIAAGYAYDLARSMAVIEAALGAALPETAGWERLLVEEEAMIAEADEAEAARIGRTRVSFDSMDREAPR